MAGMKKLDHLVLAQGEATGHAHRARGGVLYEDDEGRRVLDAGVTGTDVEHEEHKTVRVPAGRHHVGHRTEYHHADHEARPVLD